MRKGRPDGSNPPSSQTFAGSKPGLAKLTGIFAKDLPVSRKSANDPIVVIPELRDVVIMRCFYILVHGRLRWLVDPSELEVDADQPAGLYCQRYVLASDPKVAIQRAFESVSTNLDQQTGWLRDYAAELKLEAEEVSRASLLKAFLPVNRGHTFYARD